MIKKRITLSATRLLLAVLLVVTVTGCMIAQPTFRRNQPSTVSVGTERLRSHVTMLSETFHPRDWLIVLLVSGVILCRGGLSLPSDRPLPND